jgi:hypothetical protein
MKRSRLQRKTPLARMSKKRRILQRKRADFVKWELASRPWCEAGDAIRLHRMQTFGNEYAKRLSASYTCSRRSTELHEPLTRARGGNILDPHNTVAICRNCHNWVHDNPDSATRIGLLRSQHGVASDIV